MKKPWTRRLRPDTLLSSADRARSYGPRAKDPAIISCLSPLQLTVIPTHFSCKLSRSARACAITAIRAAFIAPGRMESGRKPNNRLTIRQAFTERSSEVETWNSQGQPGKRHDRVVPQSRIRHHNQQSFLFPCNRRYGY